MAKPLKTYYIEYGGFTFVLQAAHKTDAMREFNYQGYKVVYGEVLELVGEIAPEMIVVKARE